MSFLPGNQFPYSHVSRVRYDFSHPLQLISELLHGSDVGHNRLAFDHMVILISRPDNANLAWVHRFEFREECIPCDTRIIGIIDSSLELRGDA